MKTCLEVARNGNNYVEQFEIEARPPVTFDGERVARQPVVAAISWSAGDTRTRSSTMLRPMTINELEAFATLALDLVREVRSRS